MLLLGNKYVDCGLDDTRVLDFDHVDPKDKRFNLSGTTLLYSWPVVVTEAQKCVLRCKNHHWLKTLAMGDLSHRAGK